ncbi:hypothetical protein CHUAL_009596 [Chamberlinius hualienensis]
MLSGPTSYQPWNFVLILVNESTGRSPAFLTFGRQLRDMADLALKIKLDPSIPIPEPVGHCLSRLLEQLKETVGQEIHVKNHPQSSKAQAFTAKMAPRLQGSYYIQQKVSPFTYVIADRNGTTIGRYHVSNIYPTINNPVKEGAKISSLFNEEPQPPEDVEEGPPPQEIEEPKEDTITKTCCG